MDPSIKRLAVQVEDHPIEYGKFEGDIPEGQYGAGHVDIWDSGEWVPLDADPLQAYEEGHLSFELKGKKLNGRWTLVKTKFRGGKGKNWLLIKNRDEWAETVDADTLEGGASSSRKKTARKRRASLPDSSADASAISSAKSSVRSSARSFKEPQLATLVDRPPQGREWIFETKYDGYRILAQVKNGRVRLLSRRGNDWSARFHVVQDALKDLDVDSVLLDGEVVALDKKGAGDFQLLQNSLIDPKKQSNLVYYVFDVLELNGKNLETLPLEKRKQELVRVLKRHKRSKSKHLQISKALKGTGAQVFKQACAEGWEGIICKREDRPYQHARSGDWLKVKCRQTQEFVIVGFTEPKGSRELFGALLLASREDGHQLQFVGKVGTGFTREVLADVFTRLAKLKTESSPLPKKEIGEKGVHFVKPELVAEIEFHGWTNDRILRQPSFLGLREDKTAREVKIEKAQPVRDVTQKSQRSAKSQNGQKNHEADNADKTQKKTSSLTHPDRVVFEEGEVTKQDLADHYDRVSERMMPLLSGRPISLIRCPGGVAKGCFVQQNAKESLASSPGLSAIELNDDNGNPASRLQVNSAEGLTSLVQNGVVEIHVWGATSDDVEHPDQMVFDLDPGPSLEWSEVVRGTKILLRELKSRKLKYFLKLTGSRGVHVHVPLKRDYEWDEVHRYAEELARKLESKNPKLFTTTSVKKQRTGRIYIDYLRNSRGVTFVAPYAVRAKPGAPVAAPIAEKELTAKIKPNQFNVGNLKARLKKPDPWKGFAKVQNKI
jgi:bifunctional non-homologous end joining protein LigD